MPTLSGISRKCSWVVGQYHDPYTENSSAALLSTKRLNRADRRRRAMHEQQQERNIYRWTNSGAFLTKLSCALQWDGPQLTGPYEVFLKAEWSVPGLAVLWGVLIPLRSASRGVSVWLSSFLITPEWSEQLLLLHICVSISGIYEVTYAKPTGPRGGPCPPLCSPDSSTLLSCTQLSEYLWVYLAALPLDWIWLCFLLFTVIGDVVRFYFCCSRTAGRLHQAKNK